MSDLSATISVRYVNPPKQGRTNGSVKTPEGEMYGVPPALLSQFQQGGTYNVNYTTRNFQGQNYKTITHVAMVSPPQQSQGQRSNGYSKGGGDDDKLGERIFVCGILNAAVSGGHVEMSEVAIENVVNIGRAVWANTFGKKAGSPISTGRPNNDDMNDEIPF